MGWVTMEDLQWDADGRCLSHALSTYKAPDVYFMPDDLAVKFLQPEDNPYGPLGAKAVGEPPLMYGIGVFFAIRNAMKAFRPAADLTLDAPMTPERPPARPVPGNQSGGTVRAAAGFTLRRKIETDNFEFSVPGCSLLGVTDSNQTILHHLTSG